MRKRLYILFVFVFVVNAFAFSQSKSHRFTIKDYIKQYNKIAVKEMQRTGVPASITLAQGILESDNGNSTLARKANNHFGIKCHSNWKGKRIYHDDDRKGECFRKYRNVYESYKDHSNFIKKGQRYQFLFKYKTTDYKHWAKGLKKAGYATNRHYDKLLIKIIENNRLYVYDSKRKRKKIEDIEKEASVKLADVDNLYIDPFKSDVKQRNRINYIIVEKGNTFYSLAKKYELMQWQLYKYNELTKDSILKVGQILYLQPKRNKADVRHKYHIMKEGDSMYSISQLYGIKLRKLYKKNLMKVGEEPNVGDKLWLRKKRRK
ncbi:MAG: glucosaminidase domain-containing protein [Bacteroidales bacterium]|nr:glucosaminidase domain-containing protein [Bacteroidales bacterium]